MTDRRSKPFGGKVGIFIGGILLVAAVIAFISLDGYPPSDGESVGAIGAAKRYRADQISESDVQLQDQEMAALLQSDEMQKLIRDDSFQKAVRDQNWAALMDNDYFRRIFFDPVFMRLATQAGTASRQANMDFRKLSPEEAYNVFLAQLENAEFNTRGPRFSEVVGDAKFKDLFIHQQAVRDLVLDQELLRQLVQADVVSAKGDMDWRNVRSEVDFNKLRDAFTDATLAGPNPRLPQLASDADFQRLFETEAMVRRLVLDESYTRRFLDEEFLRRLPQTEFLRKGPEEAYDALLAAARAAEFATPRPRAIDMASDVEFQKWFENKMARQVAFDADFFRPLLDAKLASQLAEINYANLRPEEKYNGFRRAVEEAQLSVSKDRLLAVSQDADFIKLFYESRLMQQAVLDARYAGRFYETALALTRPQTEFQNVRPQAEYQNVRPEVEFANLRPEVALNRWLEAARDAAMVSPERSVESYAVDARYKSLFINQELARQVLTDQLLMRQLLDAGVASRLAEINYRNLRPEEALQQLQLAVADASFSTPDNKLSSLVNDAAFAELFLQNDILRAVMLDARYARDILDHAMASRTANLNLAGRTPEVAYNTWLEAAIEAKLEGRNASMAAWAADAQFKQMFESRMLVRDMMGDAKLMASMLEAGFNTMATRADLRNVVTDADYLKKFTYDD